jgi:DNA invertase Pin-like site-specific DNA recombinase
MAAVAEHEAKAISERTKVALAAAKARGVKLGGYRGDMLTAKAREAGCKARTVRAAAREQKYPAIGLDIAISARTTSAPRFARYAV